MTVTAETDGGIISAGTLTTCVWCGRSLVELQKLGHPIETEPTP
jgi:hypothetical protein